MRKLKRDMVHGIRRLPLCLGSNVGAGIQSNSGTVVAQPYRSCAGGPDMISYMGLTIHAAFKLPPRISS